MKYLLLSLLLVFIIPSLAFAQGTHTGGGTTITLQNPLGTTSTPAQLLDKILDFLIKAGAIIASIMVVIGAFQILFAAGDPERFLVGKRTIIYTVIAYGTIFMAKGIVLIIKEFLGGGSTPGTGGGIR